MYGSAEAVKHWPNNLCILKTLYLFSACSDYGLAHEAIKHCLKNVRLQQLPDVHLAKQARFATPLDLGYTPSPTKRSQKGAP